MINNIHRGIICVCLMLAMIASSMVVYGAEEPMHSEGGGQRQMSERTEPGSQGTMVQRPEDEQETRQERDVRGGELSQGRMFNYEIMDNAITTESSSEDYSIVLYSMALLGAAFVFVIFYKRRQY